MSGPTRREFLIGSAATAIATTLPAKAFAAQPINKKIRFAMIGVGGRGGAHLEPAANHGEIVAICDIDAETRAKVMLEYPEAAAFVDFRQMLDKYGDNIDAVVVATPDHNHAVASAWAMRHGKHVYCEKPLTRTIGEARRLADLARSNRVMTQMGNQGTAGSNLRKVAALVKKGTFGRVKEVHCWTNRAGGWWPQGVPRPAAAVPPKTVDWTQWLGPRPYRPYAEGYHPFAWRGWWDFGAGALGDIGCHCMNLPFMALDLRDPLAVKAQTSGHNRDSFPAWSIITYEFPKRGNREALNLYWYDGGKLPSKDIAPGVDYGENGSLIVCEHATLFSPAEYAGSTSIVGGGELPDISFVQSPGHFEEFANAVNGGPVPVSNFPGYSGPLTETVLLGNLAVWADGDRLEWDSRGMHVPGHAEYDALIHPSFPKGWEI